MITTTILFCLGIASTLGVMVPFDIGEESLNLIRDQELKSTVVSLSRQLMLQQLYVEEMTRSHGDSGLKQVRLQTTGSRPYHGDTFSGSRVASIHDHANNIRTIGMGEFVGVLNGVEFRTRHNDYRLKMPSTTSTDWHATEDIPFPDVPPEVSNKATVEEEVNEMREWFRAWKDQNATVRNYTKYFKPVLCYLEGTWTSASQNIEEPFDSDRHRIDANSWFDLQDKIRFTSYTGRKSRFENFAYLPTTVIGLLNDSIPQYAQWNYRILCHPLQRDVPFKMFRLLDDLSSRMAFGRSMAQHEYSRAARFQLSPDGTGDFAEEYRQRRGFLDELMEEIPGKDNYPGQITDKALDEEINDMNGNSLNSAYYHRWYTTQRDAMGSSIRSRGFADETLFVALNSQAKVPPVGYEKCIWDRSIRKRVCNQIEQRASYAVPLEIIYMTPLSKWNPYNLQYKGEAGSVMGKTVNADGRTGGTEPEKAYNGINSKIFYQTPNELFAGAGSGGDSADTVRRFGVGVLDTAGQVKLVRASGTRIFLPDIAGVGHIRQRWPIMPAHDQGSGVWKELEALKDIVLKSQSFGHFTVEPLSASGDGSSSAPVAAMSLQMGYSNKAGIPRHTHEFELSAKDQRQLDGGLRVYVTTSESTGHTHRLTIQKFTNGLMLIRTCDGQNWSCPDGHDRYMAVLDKDEM